MPTSPVKLTGFSGFAWALRATAPAIERTAQSAASVPSPVT
jgi:hypothetical protein